MTRSGLRIRMGVRARVFAVGVLTAICACMENQEASGPGPVKPPASPARPIALRKAATPTCRPPADRPAAGDAEVKEMPDQGAVLVRYSATPRDAPCETLDLLFRTRDGMLIGDPSGQVELVWTAEREIRDDAQMSVLVASTPVALSSEMKRQGSRVEVSSRAPASIVASYGSEAIPTFVISDRRIELSIRQTAHLQRFLGHLPFYRIAGPRPPADRPKAAAPAPPPVDADPAAGTGWFCVEAPTRGDIKKRSSSCHRTAAECEQARASMAATESQVGDCIPSPAAECHSWRTSTGSERSCFYRPSQCARDALSRSEKEGSSAQVGAGCYRAR